MTGPHCNSQDIAELLAGIAPDEAAAVAERIRAIAGSPGSQSSGRRGCGRLTVWADALDAVATLPTKRTSDEAAEVVERIDAILESSTRGWDDRTRTVPLPAVLIAAVTVLTHDESLPL